MDSSFRKIRFGRRNIPTNVGGAHFANHPKWGIGGIYSPFVKGNKCAAAENMEPDAHAKRIAGLIKSWSSHERIKRGERVVRRRTRIKLKRRYNQKLRTTFAKEAREIQHLAKTHAVAAMRRLATIVNDPDSPETAAIAAAEVIMNRAYGRPTQININDNVNSNGKPSEVPLKELDTRVEEALKRVENLTGRKKKPVISPPKPPDLRKLH